MKFAITDLAVELLRRNPHHDRGITVKSRKTDGVKITTTQITNETGAAAIGKPVGTYINIECAVGDDISAVLADELGKLIVCERLGVLQQDHVPCPAKRGSCASCAKFPKGSEQKKRAPRILVVGLGNDRFVADSLGPRVLSYIETGENMMTFEPNVAGITGINSVDAVKQIAAIARPDVAVVIDSLVSGSADKIGCNYQIATTGITPGSGIGRDNKRLDAEFLGVPVLAIGVPICTIISAGKKILHATVKEIDQIIAFCALNIAGGVNNMKI